MNHLKVFPVFDIREATFSSDSSEDGRLAHEDGRKCDRQLVEEADKGLMDGVWKRRRLALSGIKSVWAACFHEAATVFVCLGKEALTDTLPFVFSIEGVPQWWHPVRSKSISLR